MGGYAVAHLDEIEELDDGRSPLRPVRHHLGITAFGVNAWTARKAGDRIINEHDESDEDSDEELYLVLRGSATFELDGDKVAAPVGTFVFARPGLKRTAIADEAGTTIIALGGTPGKAYEPDGWELWGTIRPLYEAGAYAEAADRGRDCWPRRTRSTAGCSTTSPAVRAPPVGPPMRSTTSGARSRCRSDSASMRRTTRTSTRSARSPRSPS